MPHDGTQDPGPPPLMPDALTGGTYDTEAVRVRVVEPVMPDMTAVREAMKAVLDDDDELSSLIADDPPAGEIPSPRAEQKAPPESPAERTLPRIPAARMPVPAPLPAEVTNTAPRRRRRGFTPGASAIVALLLVFAVLAVILVVEPRRHDIFAVQLTFPPARPTARPVTSYGPTIRPCTRPGYSGARAVWRWGGGYQRGR